MSFPKSIASYLDEYAGMVSQALASVNREGLVAAEALIINTVRADAAIYACGNGGSAAISNHLQCDHGKGIHFDTGLRPRVHSLAANVETLTAVANDMSYADVFAHPLSIVGRPGDLLITISASGDSENIVRAMAWAKANGLATIAMTGFAGGRSARTADVNLHVDAHNYGVVEDVHQSLMHVLAQFIRQSQASDPKRTITL